MELGSAGKWALVGGASKGLGWGCAAALVQEGVLDAALTSSTSLIINSRSSLFGASSYQLLPVPH